MCKMLVVHENFCSHTCTSKSREQTWYVVSHSCLCESYRSWCQGWIHSPGPSPSSWVMGLPALVGMRERECVWRCVEVLEVCVHPTDSDRKLKGQSSKVYQKGKRSVPGCPCCPTSDSPSPGERRGEWGWGLEECGGCVELCGCGGECGMCGMFGVGVGRSWRLWGMTVCGGGWGMEVGGVCEDVEVGLWELRWWRWVGCWGMWSLWSCEVCECGGVADVEVELGSVRWWSYGGAQTCEGVWNCKERRG